MLVMSDLNYNRIYTEVHNKKCNICNKLYNHSNCVVCPNYQNTCMGNSLHADIRLSPDLQMIGG